MERRTNQPKPTRPEVELLLRSAKSTGEGDTYPGKRGATRISEGLQLEVTKDPSKSKGTFASTLHNVSESGCAFWFRQKLDRRTKMYLREFSPDNSLPWIDSFVTHCTQGIRGFLVGVSFRADEK
jgi:hypothetical protein